MKYLLTAFTALLIFTGCSSHYVGHRDHEPFKQEILGKNYGLDKSNYTITNPVIDIKMLATYEEHVTFTRTMNYIRNSKRHSSNKTIDTIITTLHTIPETPVEIRINNNQIIKTKTSKEGSFSIPIEKYLPNENKNQVLHLSFIFPNCDNFTDTLTIPASFITQLLKIREEELAKKKAEEKQQKIDSARKISEAKAELARIENIVKRKGTRLTGAISYLMRLEDTSDYIYNNQRYKILRTKLRKFVDIDIKVLTLSSSRLEYYRHIGLEDFLTYQGDLAATLIRAFDSYDKAYSLFNALSLEDAIEIIMRRRAKVEDRPASRKTYTNGIERVFGYEFRKALDKLCIPH